MAQDKHDGLAVVKPTAVINSLSLVTHYSFKEVLMAQDKHVYFFGGDDKPTAAINTFTSLAAR